MPLGTGQLRASGAPPSLLLRPDVQAAVPGPNIKLTRLHVQYRCAGEQEHLALWKELEQRSTVAVGSSCQPRRSHFTPGRAGGWAPAATGAAALVVALGRQSSRRSGLAGSRPSWCSGRGWRVLAAAAPGSEAPSSSDAEAAGESPLGEELEAMMSELRGLESSRSSTDDALDRSSDDDEAEDNAIDVRDIDRSGQVCVLGVPNSGKSSLVNALVGAKVSIVSPKPQTTRQRVLGLALLSPRPDAPPTTQAVFVDTAGIMQVGVTTENSSYMKTRTKRLFKESRLHKAMVRTAWKATRNSDAICWVLDGCKCFMYGDFMPAKTELDGIALAPEIPDAWWMNPELDEELAFLQRLRNRKLRVSVILNKTDLLRDMHVDVEDFTLTMRRRLDEDLGRNDKGEALLQNLWPTSVLLEPDSLMPLKRWLCETLPRQSPIYPLDHISDVPARVAVSEITREKLFEVLREEVPYHLTVVNAVWREEADGTLKLGQKVVVQTQGQGKIVRARLRAITEEAETEISEAVNGGKPVELHFRVSVEPKWQENEEYYQDVQGLLDQTGSLSFYG